MGEIVLSVFVALEDMDTDPEMRVGKVIKRGKGLPPSSRVSTAFGART